MKVLVLQPYLPDYRVPLFSSLEKLLVEDGGSLTVVAPKIIGTQAERGDSATASWHRSVRADEWQTPLGPFKYRYSTRELASKADVAVYELDPGNINAWAMLLTPARPAVVLWGHGKTYISDARWATDRARLLAAHMADTIMTYTEAGARHMIEGGIAEDRVSAIGNATDTTLLHSLRSSVDPHDQSIAGIPRNELQGRNLAIYVGGLDGPKRIPFLLDAARSAYALDSSFQLIVGGSGTDSDRVQTAASECPGIRWMPKVSPAQLAELGSVARMIWMPGRIGLIAVDALTLGLPIMTTAYRYHAPEYDYLTTGSSVRVLDDNPEDFGRQAMSLMEMLPSGGIPTQPRYSVERAAEAILESIERAHAHRCNRRRWVL